MSNKPIVHHSRPSELVWHETFQSANWVQSFQHRKRSNPNKFVLSHKRLSDVSYFQNLNFGQITSQLSCFDEFDKHKLVNNVNKHRKINKKYSILPLSFVLPFQTELFKKFQEKHPDVWMIDKLSSGTLGNHISIMKPSAVDLTSSKIRVVQEYLSDTALFKDHKFDLRVYLMITSIDPLIAYVYNDGYGKIAAKRYQQPSEENKDDLGVHLTNFAQSKKFFNGSDCSVEGGIQSFVDFSELIQELFDNKQQFTDQKLLKIDNIDDFTKEFHKRLRNLFQKLLVSSQEQMLKTDLKTNLTHVYPRRYYARYGADVMILRNGSFKLIEVNRRPQQHTDCKAQKVIAPQLIIDELNLVGIPCISKVDGETEAILNPMMKLEGENEAQQNQIKALRYHETYTIDQLKQMKEIDFDSLSPFEQRALQQITDEEQRLGAWNRIWPNTFQQNVEDLGNQTYMNWLAHKYLIGNLNLRK